MVRDPLAMISDSESTDQHLLWALIRLGKVTEPASYWSKLANSTKYRKTHRILCVNQLFKRHVQRSIKVSVFARLLDDPNWMLDNEVQLLGSISGWIPVEPSLGDTILIVRVFADSPEAHENIYLKVRGEMSVDEFVKAMRGNGNAERMQDRVLLDYGF
jgi:hypothetical protein